MAVNILNTSTLSEAITGDSIEFTVGSTSNITAGKLLAIRDEVVEVTSVPVSGRVKVRRGISGSRAHSHASGTRFFIGSPSDFKSIRDNALALVGNAAELPEYLLPGAHAIDGAGNEYVMVELTETVVPGATVLISKDGNFTAGVLTSAGVGNVGVIAESASSDQYAWAQISGYVAHAKLVGGSSLVTSLGEFGGATSVSTPSVGLLGRSSSQRSSDYLVASTINGMFPVSAASTASTSASSETGLFCSAWLNYPWAQRAITS